MANVVQMSDQPRSAPSPRPSPERWRVGAATPQAQLLLRQIVDDLQVLMGRGESLSAVADYVRFMKDHPLLGLLVLCGGWIAG